MATRTTTQFKALYGTTGTLFPDNTTGDISEADIRAQGEDIADSFLNVATTPPIYFGGTWAFPSGAFPTSTYAGTIYVATADKGSPGDADYVASGTRMMSLINGANSYTGYTYW